MLCIQDFELDPAFELGMLNVRWFRKHAENWERRTLQGFNKNSAISKAMRQRAVDKGVKPKYTYLLPNEVDLKETEPEGDGQKATIHTETSWVKAMGHLCFPIQAP
jgi:hypothetical protein